MGKRTDLAMRGKIDRQGRITVPNAIRRQLGFGPDEPLTLLVEGDSLRVLTIKQAIKNAQALTRKHVDGRTGLVDEFLRERRQDSGD